MPNRHKSLIILTGDFPLRSETFVATHACGMAKYGWSVQTLANEVGAGITASELAAIDELGLQRHYCAWPLSRVRRLGAMCTDVLRDPTAMRYWNGSGAWTRTELFTARRKYNFLTSKSASYYHVHFGSVAAQLSEIGWNRPTVVTWHGFDANVLPRLRGANIYQELFARDWTHTVGSDFMYSRLIELGVREDSLIKIPMGVDLNKFEFVDRTARRSGPLKVISVGRLDEMKGHRYLIEAIAQAKRYGVEVQAKIIGEGATRSAIEGQISKHNLGSSVELLGAQSTSRVKAELAWADLFALTGVISTTGRVETQGVVYIEAQATGLPVIATAVGGVSESLIPGKTGLLVPSKDVNAIAGALAIYAQDTVLRLAHGKAGSEFVRKKFDATVMLDSFENLYFQNPST